MSIKLFNENTYEITLCGCDGSTTMLVNLNPYELQFMNYLAELSKELSYTACMPQIEVDKFPADEFYRKQLDDIDMKYYTELVEQHRKAFEKIKERLNEQKQNSTPNTNQ